jgi:RNA polymerase sigma factor (sigma-70 family)
MGRRATPWPRGWAASLGTGSIACVVAAALLAGPAAAQGPAAETDATAPTNEAGEVVANVSARGDRPALSHSERLGHDDAGFELVEDRSVIDRAWRALDPRERETLILRLAHDLTYREIAERLDMSVTHVVRLATRGLERLRAVAQASDQR